MFKSEDNSALDFGSDNIIKILLKLAPPVMFAQLIQALYNIIDSFFIGQYSEDGLTALSIIYPVQLLMIALAVGTGVGINTLMAGYSGVGKNREAEETAGTGTILAVIMWVIFAMICYMIMPSYTRMSTHSETVIEQVTLYGRIVCVFSIGLFMESIWTKVLQSGGNMRIPMIAQIMGAIINIILDPVLIFGFWKIPAMGISGAAMATVLGQMAAALIVMKQGFRKSPELRKYPAYIKSIYRFGFPNILMQSAYTFYILGLNLILKTFSNEAITALGLYYKWQTFFFIPLGALQTCIVPIIRYNYSAGKYDRCRKTLTSSVMIGLCLMFVGTLCFELIPSQLISVFSQDALVLSIGTFAFRWIGISFIPMVTSLIFPVFFQAAGCAIRSSLLTILRTVILFVPLGWVFSRFGLERFWMTFVVTETITTVIGFFFYDAFKKENHTVIECDTDSNVMNF
ncbi:MATE family efflux transporter [uncultured Clostridium sp.]|uniref:MATE family efflux transporter n=1 Tax=uncultured Clostridium sp. TaxID=59620 RepID=UPI0025F579F3|nr:MATE family efflux transporter [uncultured Clostridium sp.]